MSKALLQLSLQQTPERPVSIPGADASTAEAAPSSWRGLQHLPQRRLDLIVQQVRRQGFHVEYWTELEQGARGGETWDALTCWCRFNGLQVSVNQVGGICFFESRCGSTP